MLWKLRILPMALILFLCCCSCGPAVTETSPQAASTPPASEVSPTPSDAPVSPSEQVSPAPVELPLPSGKTFGLEGVDAVLYDAAVDYYSTKGGKADLLIPSLGVLDTYQTEDGSTCYICRFRGYDYYNLGYGLGDLEDPQYNLGSGGYDLARFTVSKTESGALACTEVFVSWDGEGWPASIRIICGPKADLAAAIIKNETLPVQIRNLTPSDPEELLRIYLNYTFGSGDQVNTTS